MNYVVLQAFCAATFKETNMQVRKQKLVGWIWFWWPLVETPELEQVHVWAGQTATSSPQAIPSSLPLFQSCSFFISLSRSRSRLSLLSPPLAMSGAGWAESPWFHGGKTNKTIMTHSHGLLQTTETSRMKRGDSSVHKPNQCVQSKHSAQGYDKSRLSLRHLYV